MAVIKDSLKVIIISSVISLSALFVFAQTGWFEPSAAPPGDNRPAPLTLDSEGGLTIPGNLKIDGGLNFQGSLIKITYRNLGEDSYTNYRCETCSTTVDLCFNPNREEEYFPKKIDFECNSNQETAYNCPADVTRPSCIDWYRDSACDKRWFGYNITPGYRIRDVTCIKQGVVEIQ